MFLYIVIHPKLIYMFFDLEPIVPLTAVQCRKCLTSSDNSHDQVNLPYFSHQPRISQNFKCPGRQANPQILQKKVRYKIYISQMREEVLVKHIHLICTDELQKALIR